MSTTMSTMQQQRRILLVDDDLQALDSTRKILELEGYEVVSAADGQIALDHARDSLFDLVLTDVRMPKMGGLEFLRALSVCGNMTPVILMTAFGRVEDAVWAMKFGAVDFLTKPFKRQAVVSAVEAALKRSRPRSNVRTPYVESLLIGGSSGMRGVHSLIRQVGPTAATVLITGESGTGKEMVARCLHEESPRGGGKGKFTALNCAAFPENLIESELFGYEKGAFTGATTAKAGIFEASDGGTLFLDEIGDMPISLQSKLLRVLQEGEVRRVGSTYSRKVDVRLIAATHRDLKERAREGSFRQDLMYRLEVIGVHLPPLRERMEDLPDLAYHFLRQAAERHSKPMEGILDDAMEPLLNHSWPGNIRELSNVIERAVVLTRSNHVTAEDLPAHLLAVAEGQQQQQQSDRQTISVPLGTPLKDVEDMLIRKTLEATDGDKNMTAKLLGINSRTIYRKLK